MYQKTILIGNLGDDPKMRFTPSGTPVTSFPVAVNRRWTDADGNPQEKTTWFRVNAWARLAEVCNQYLTKGRLVMVEGDVSASSWVSQDGEARATLEIKARTVKFLGRSGQPDGTEEGEAPVSVPTPAQEGVEASVPF